MISIYKRSPSDKLEVLELSLDVVSLALESSVVAPQLFRVKPLQLECRLQVTVHAGR